MEPFALQTALVLFLASVAGSLLPLYRRWSDRGLHVFVALAAGIFLGTIFLHLLPHLAGADLGGDHAGHAHGAGEHAGEGAGLLPWAAALAGLLLLFALEKVWLPLWRRGASLSTLADPHTGLWAATYVGLSLHAITAGLSLSAILADPAARTQLLVSVLIHKATETFSLATVMRLASLSTPRMVALILVFAAIEPAGLLFGSGLIGVAPGVDLAIMGLACGTFLYVAVCDLLPEVFHGAERPALKLLAVVAGIGVTALTLPRLSSALEFGRTVLVESARIFVEFAPFLILGFVVAGVLSQIVRLERFTKHLRGDDLKSVGLAALVGAPLPLCSCSVVPVGVALRRAGASKGATSSFLIATPETGVDSLTVTWALLDPVMTIARPIGAVLSAVFTGSAVNVLVRRGWDRAPSAVAAQPAAEPACCHAEPAPSCAETAEPAAAALAHDDGHAHGRERARSAWIVRVLRYAFVEMLDDLAVSLLIGTLISGAIAVLVPAELFESPIAHGFTGMLLMLAIGIPTYVCAAASTPIAATLILKGMDPSAAFVFLLASPATNLGSLFVLSRELGARVVLVHVAALAAVTLALGFGIGAAYRLLAIEPRASVGAVHEHAPSLGILCAVLLGALILASLARTRGAGELLSRLRAARPAVR